MCSSRLLNRGWELSSSYVLNVRRMVQETGPWTPSWLRISHTVNEDMIHEIFSSYGEVLKIHMMKDQNGASKGYCFVRFATKEVAMKAQQEKSNLTLQGKNIGAALSSDKDTLFLGNLCKDWVSKACRINRFAPMAQNQLNI